MRYRLFSEEPFERVTSLFAQVLNYRGGSLLDLGPNMLLDHRADAGPVPRIMVLADHPGEFQVNRHIPIIIREEIHILDQTR